MKKNDLKNIHQQSITEISKKVETLRKEIATMILEQVTTAPKDTNIVRRKKTDLAQLLTIIREKELYGKTT